jgi:hypothetical protein
VTPETAAMFPPLTFTLPLMVGIRYQFFHWKVLMLNNNLRRCPTFMH